MELEFDKEMDSLLRKADRGVLVGDQPDEKPKVHLDANQISAFAENALPERSRALYMSHLADCDRCRRILSGLIALNAEAMPAEQRVVAPAVSPAALEPWYRRLLLPNLAYVMGGLVLVFGGLIAISVLQSSENGEVSMSQPAANVAAPAARGPMFEDAQSATDQIAPLESMNANSNASVAASNSMSVANKPSASANSMANAASGAPLEPPADMRKESDRDSERERRISLDGVDAAKPAMAAPAAPVTTAQPPPAAEKTAIADATVAAGESKDDAKAKSVSAKKIEDLPIAGRQTQELARTQAGGVAKSTPGPSRDAQQNFPNRANNTFDLYEEKRISGKTFQRKNNVWYDISYRSQATINIRRGSDEYRKLDGGLRSIAESLSGVVVVVWSGKAYRIQ